MERLTEERLAIIEDVFERLEAMRNAGLEKSVSIETAMLAVGLVPKIPELCHEIRHLWDGIKTYRETKPLGLPGQYRDAWLIMEKLSRELEAAKGEGQE